MDKEYTKQEDKLVETITETKEEVFSYGDILANIDQLQASIAFHEAEKEAQVALMWEKLAVWNARKDEADKLGLKSSSETQETPEIVE